jgi:hypothetical protein
VVIRTELSLSDSIPWLNHCMGTTRVVLRHFVNVPFHQYAILSASHFVNLTLFNLTFIQFGILLTCHLVKMPSCHFVSSPFSQLTILSTCHFVSLSFCQLAILSTLFMFVYVIYFTEYSAHFYTLKMMLKYSLRSIHGR